MISVIVPIYNTERWLVRCIESIICQTYSDLEIILIDDGSTDDSAKICDKYADVDDRIRVFHKKNGGSSSARNYGIDVATGDYIGFVDSDDYIDPDMYELLIEGIIQSGLMISQIGRNEIDESGARLKDVCISHSNNRICSNDVFLEELLLHQGDCSFCTKLIAREMFVNMRFPEGELNEDFYLIVNMLDDISGIYIIPNQCYHVCYRSGSNTRLSEIDRLSRVFIDIVNNADKVMDKVNRCYPNLKEQAIRFSLYQRLDYLLHVPINDMNQDNEFYISVVAYIREHIKYTISNRYLGIKNKTYILLLGINPVLIRRVHRLSMILRGNCCK